MVDSSLSIAGAAADAKVTGDIRNALDKYGEYDVWKPTVISQLNGGNLPSNLTHNGILFIIQTDGSVSASGTFTSASAFRNIYNISNALPEGMYPGKQFELKWNSERVSFRLYWYINGTLGSLAVKTLNDAIVSIPNEATGCLIRVMVERTTINETISEQATNCAILTDVSGQHIWQYITNKNLGESLRHVFLQTGTDLNTVEKNIFNVLPISGEFDNCPIPSGNRRLFIDLSYSQIIWNLNTGKKYTRAYYDNAWGEWHLNENRFDDIYLYESSSSNISVPNTGVKIRVMSYNVANYDNNTSIKLPIEKEINLKRIISEINADIVGTQEDQPYIDVDQIKDSVAYIWKPIYPFKIGDGSVSIHAKDTISNEKMVQYTNNRYLRSCLTTINNKTLLIISTHPMYGSDSAAISARLQQYTELFQWIHKEITLNSVSTGTSVTCPDWDYCIITGDFNSTTTSDLTNLKTLSEARGFTMANGGYLGWMKTCKESTGNFLALDNIIVSGNIIINSAKSYYSYYDDLYSDHVPLIADLTLLS